MNKSETVSLASRTGLKGVMSVVLRVGLLAAICFLGVAIAWGDDPPDEAPMNQFMQAKLLHCQKVLEGLVSEDFPAIAKHAQAMTLLSQDASWHVLQTKEYIQRSTEFRRATAQLQKSAQRKNLDGATLAYLDVTLRCVECHKYVRDKAKQDKLSLLLRVPEATQALPQIRTE